MAHASTTLTFHIHHGDAPVRTEVLTQDIVKIGKLPSSHLRIDDDDVSRMHAVIEVSEGQVHVIDLGSATGTIVNGKKVNKAGLVSGDEMIIGRARVMLEVASTAITLAPELARPIAFAIPAMPLLPNPFAAPAAAIAAAPIAEEASTEAEFGIAASGPALNPADVETMAIAAEVVILWGDRSVLHVAHLSPPRAFTIGEPGGAAMPDFVIDGLALGGDRMPLTLESAGNVVVVIPAGASGEVRIGEDVQSIEQLRERGRLSLCSALAGAEHYTLPHGASATIRFHGFTFITKATSAGRRVGAEGETSYRGHVWTALSLGVHAAFLLMFYFLPPTASALSLDLVRPDDRLVQYLMTPPETEDLEVPDWVNSDEPSGGTGQAHEGPSGAMGETSSAHTTHRSGIEGHADHTEMSREQQRTQTQQVASALGTMLTQLGSFGPTSPYGSEQALGMDAISALGALTGDQTGANFGFNGLGMNGTGRGGGGFGQGTYGQGRLGTIGGGAGTGSGDGYGDGVTLHGGRHAHVPGPIHLGTAEVHGSLSAEVIRRTIRRHVNEVRFCYEQGLSARPDLAGRVTVSFIIGATGAVQSSAVRDTTLGDSRVESCITQAVHRWTFPAPDNGGVVGVNYPFMLDAAASPGES